jgi:hypothetical protein
MEFLSCPVNKSAFHFKFNDEYPYFILVVRFLNRFGFGQRSKGELMT